MSLELSPSSPEKKEVIDDNARKFTLESLPPKVLSDNNASSFLLTTDWMITDEDSEKKVVCKQFDNGDIQRILISKVTNNGHRVSEKEKLSPEQYGEYLQSSILHVKKMRHEFNYEQDGVSFSLKYDEFTDNDLRVLEVDGSSEEARNSFDAASFPCKLVEVTGSIDYYGYRIASFLG
jgi:hypothetical protein